MAKHEPGDPATWLTTGQARELRHIAKSPLHQFTKSQYADCIMPITEWSEDILIVDLSDEPNFSDDLNGLMRRLDSVRVPDMAAAGTAPDVILNFKGVSYLNSSNIAQLLRVRQMLSNAGGRLRLCSVGDQVWSVLLITGLDKLYEFTGDVATSLASLQIEDERSDFSADRS